MVRQNGWSGKCEGVCGRWLRPMGPKDSSVGDDRPAHASKHMCSKCYNLWRKGEIERTPAAPGAQPERRPSEDFLQPTALVWRTDLDDTEKAALSNIRRALHGDERAVEAMGDLLNFRTKTGLRELRMDLSLAERM